MTFVLKSAAQIGKMIDQTIAHTQKGDALIHATAVQCIAHAAPNAQGGHGDATLLDRLVKGLGKSSIRVVGLRVWVKEFTPITWNGDDKIGIIKAGQNGYKPFDIAGADETPFWELAAADERTARPLTIDQMLRVVHGLKGRLEKAVEKNTFEGDVAKATAFVTSIESFADGLVSNLGIHDGTYDPEDPENAVAPKPAPDAVPAPAATPRKARQKAA